MRILNPNLWDGGGRGVSQTTFNFSLILVVVLQILQNLQPVSPKISITPGNPDNVNRPWRIWSGNPCQPCNIEDVVGKSQLLFGACISPCFHNFTRSTTNRAEKCVPGIDGFSFKCECKPEYGGKFCEKPLQQEETMLNLIDTDQVNVNNIVASVIPIGNEADYLFECKYPNNTQVQYELTYIRDYSDYINVLTTGQPQGQGKFKCSETAFHFGFEDRCSNVISKDQCGFCRESRYEHPSNPFDQYAFGNFVWDVYNGEKCENVIEIVTLQNGWNKDMVPLRKNVNCEVRKPEDETYRGGCRLSTTAKDVCIENSHMGHRCRTCDKGLWGNKCQFVIEGEWKGCTEPRYMENPCGEGGTLVERPNGKFCVCPPGKLDGFVNVFEDRVKEPDCSPAGMESNGKNDNVHFADVTSKYYKFFVGMSQFHTYYGCQIDDPCDTDKFQCDVDRGTREIVDLIDEESYGFKVVNFVRSRLTALEIHNKPKCICNCLPGHGYEGDSCELINPCFFDKNYCQNLGTCRRFNDTEKTCDCSPPYYGTQCEIVNPCQIQDVCEGPVQRCFPCKHGGKCEQKGSISLPTSSYEFSCDCSSISYVGKLCEFAQGEIDLNVLTANPQHIMVGLEESYEIIVRKIGDNPHIIVDMGDGFHFSITEDLLALGSRSGAINIDQNGNYFYQFQHTYTRESEYVIRAFITNGDPNPNEKPDQIDPMYLSGHSFEDITVLLPVEWKCLPDVRLINVGSTVDESPPYTRKNEFTVESVFKPKCDEIFDFDYVWSLHKLDSSPFPTPSSENNWHIEKLVDVSQKHVTFKPYSLLNGRYIIEYAVFVEVNGIRRSNSAKGYFKIELNPPKIVIQGGLERSVDISEDIVLDASESLDESFPELSQELTFDWLCEFPCNLGPWKDSGPVIKIPAGTLGRGIEYKFHVDVSIVHKNIKRSSMATVNLLGAHGSLHLNCIENCEPKNPGDEILLFCTCLTCSTPPEVEFSWEPVSDNVIPIGREDKSFAAMGLPAVAQGDNTPRTVTCKTLSTGLLAKLSVRVNTPPYGGKCRIEPEEGFYLITSFDINCEGYIDEDVPLEYSFYVNRNGKQEKDLDSLFLLAHDTNPRATNVFLPYDLNSGKTVVFVKVTDRRELSFIEEINVQVTLPEPGEYPDLLRDLISGNNSLMRRRKKFGNDQGVMQLQLVVLYGLLDNQFIGLSQDDIQELRKAMSSVLSEIPLHSFKAVEQTLGTLYLLKQLGEDENLESLKESSVLLFNGTSRLAKFVLNDNQLIPRESVDTLARAATDSLRRVLKIAYEKGNEAILLQPNHPKNDRQLTDFDADDDVEREYFFDVHELEDEFENEGDPEIQEGLNKMLEEYAKLSHHAVTGLEHLLDAVGERLQDGAVFTVKTEDLTVYVDYERKVNTIGSPLTLETSSGKAITLKMPDDLQSMLESQGISNIILEVIEVVENPFFDDTSAILGTPVVSVVVKDRTPGGERLPIHLRRLKEPLEFYVSLTPTAKDVLELSKSVRTIVLKPLHEMSEMDLQPFHLILPYNTRVVITIEDFSVDMEFSVVVLKDFWPIKQDYCDVKTIKILNEANGYSTHFETETLGLNEEPEEHFLEYYIGIFPYQPKVFSEQRKYSVYFTRSGCLFRDENKKIWSEEGCRIGKDSNTTNLHCICNHASIFAGTQFAVASRIPTITVSDFNPEKFEQNSTVVITVCLIVVVYLLGVVICWILDRRSKERNVGLTIISDVVGCSDYSHYLVTVLTGSRFQSGSTANISVQMYGSKGRSQVYVLKENLSQVLNRGGTDSFLVASVKELGQLVKLRVWHDNFGSSPNWFCRKIIIRNVKSEKEWFFFINQWLQVSGADESTIIFEANAETDAEHRQLSRHFEETLMDLIDTSNWISLLWCRAASKFTRCQRLTRDFAVLAFYMLLNMLILFDEEDAVDTCDFRAYLYACIISVLALPVGYVIMFLFRCIRRRFIPTLVIRGNVYKQTKTVTIPAKHLPLIGSIRSKNAGISVFENDESVIMSGAGDNRDFEDVSDVSSNFSIPSTNIEDLEDWILKTDTADSEHTRRLIKENGMTNAERITLGRTGLVHAIRAINADSFIFTGEHGISEIEDLIDDEILSYFIKSDIKEPFNDVPVRNVSDQTAQWIGEKHLEQLHPNLPELEQDQSSLPSNATEKQSEKTRDLFFDAFEMSPLHKRGFYLPWWCLFITWLLCLGFIIVCLYLSFIYGRQISHEKSQNWLIGIATSTICSLILIQPVGDTFLAFILAVCEGKSTKHVQKRFQIILKESEVNDLRYRKALSINIFQPSGIHVPLTGNEIFRFRVKARRREKVKRTLLKLLFYGFILIPLIIIAYAQQSNDFFRIVDNLRGELKLNSVPKVNGKFRSFPAVRNEEMLFEYLENIFVPVVHPESLYNGAQVRPKRFDPVFLIDGQNLLLGVPRIRQVRVRPEECNAVSSVESTFSKCFSPYHSSTRDTGTYNPLWKPIINGMRGTPRKGNDIWKFQELNPGFSRSLTVQYDMGLYDGGGYVAELGRKTRETLNVLNYLKRSRWIDHQTRGVFIEFTIWNPSVNVYADVVLVFERGATEIAHTTHHIKPLFLSATDCLKANPLLEISYGIIFVSLFVLVIIFCWNIFSSDELRVYENLWFWMDFLVIFCIFVSLLIAVKSRSVDSEALDHVQTMKVNQSVSLQLVAYWNGLLRDAFSITQCVCLIRIWRVFILLDERFFVVFLTLKLATNMIVAYIAVIFIIMMAFACSGHVIFGSDILEFDSLTDSMISLADQVLDVNFFKDLTANPFLGPVYSCFFGFIVTNVSLHLLLYILNQSLHHAKRIVEEKRRKWDYYYYWDVVRRLLGRHRNSKNASLRSLKISTERMEEIKRAAALYFRRCLQSSEAVSLRALKQYTNTFLQGTGYHVIERKSRHHHEEVSKEFSIIEMRTATAEFLIAKIGSEMSSEEFESYADFNRKVILLRLQKLDTQLTKIARKVRTLH